MGKIPAIALSPEGFYLPTIKAWNILYSQIVDEITENTQKAGLKTPKALGSVQDLEKTICGHCGEDYIRRKWGTNYALNTAIIICPTVYSDKNHPTDYFVEVWSDGNVKFGEDYSKIMSKLSPEEKMMNHHRFSDPRIKRTYADKFALFLDDMDKLAKYGPSVGLLANLLHVHK